jgi:hypothetical protein
MARIRSVEYRQYKRARERVLTRLANAYPDEYQRLLQEERANESNKDSGTGDDGGTTSLVDTRASSTFARSSAANRGEDEGDRGGEA